MSDHLYLCHRCGNIFRLPGSNVCTLVKELKCPRCGDTQIGELPTWVPLGSDLSAGESRWQYECQQCRKKFTLPVPDSPSREKNIKCPACGGGHIHRLTSSGYEPLYCG